MGVFGQTPDVLINEVLNVHIVKFILQIPVAGGVGGSRGSNHSPPPPPKGGIIFKISHFCFLKS